LAKMVKLTNSLVEPRTRGENNRPLTANRITAKSLKPLKNW
jgi:hypothetical protein